MELGKLKRFARQTRSKLLQQVAARLDWVLEHDDAYLRAHATEKEMIVERIAEIGKEQLVEEVAYTWFNRVAALRYMDNRAMNPVRIVSPAEGHSQIELLSHIKRGMLPEGLDAYRDDIAAVLDGKVQTEQPDREAYKLALLGWCNHLGGVMPFLFKRVEDWAALLLPSDLISAESFIADIQAGIRPDECDNVEIIGWLYQFYISEKKDFVFEKLRKNTKITPENIPAATQLFTPHWIVRYMTENSLGRLWLLNRPESGIVDDMEYYIPPEEVESDYLRVQGPEEIKVCDPACGSGHMLVYAFDLLYRMYEEEGYASAEIPEQILKNNLYGIEIDERAGELAAFALVMKARERDRRFFRREVQPNIMVLRPVDTSGFASLDRVIDIIAESGIGKAALRHDVELFSAADNFGSLLKPELSADECRRAIARMSEYKSEVGHLRLEDDELLERLTRALQMAAYLAESYHVVIANPPYMGSKGMNSDLSKWAKEAFPDSKSDLFAMFIERNLDMALMGGAVTMITMQSWMFLSSFEKLREKILSEHTLITMAHLGARAFDSIGGEVVSTTSFVIEKGHRPNYRGGFLRLVEGANEAEKAQMIRNIAVELSRN